MIANSHVKAAKSAPARDEFNSRIARLQPGTGPAETALPRNRRHGRNTSATSIRPSSVIPPATSTAGCCGCPEIMTRNDFRVMLSKEHQELIESNFATHAEPASVPSPRGAAVRHRRNHP